MRIAETEGREDTVPVTGIGGFLAGHVALATRLMT